MGAIGGANKFNGTMQALFAVVAMSSKLKFYDAMGLEFPDREKPAGKTLTLYEKTRDYAPAIRNAVVRTREEAMVHMAFLVEKANMGGYRLCRMAKTGGHIYSGEVFPTWDLFWRAMRTLEDAVKQATEVEP